MRDMSDVFVGSSITPNRAAGSAFSAISLTARYAEEGGWFDQVSMPDVPFPIVGLDLVSMPDWGREETSGRRAIGR